MKLTEKQFENLRSSVESVISGMVSSLIEETMDDYYRGQVMKSLSKDLFTEDEVEEIIGEMWDDVEKEGGIDIDILKGFVTEVVNSIMIKYK